MYTFSEGGYSNTAGDGLVRDGNNWDYLHYGKKFSTTKDNDNDNVDH